MENNIHDKRITKRKKLTTDYHPSSWAVKQSSQIFRTLFKTLSAASFVDVEIRNEKQFLRKLIGHIHFVALLRRGNLDYCCK